MTGQYAKLLDGVLSIFSEPTLTVGLTIYKPPTDELMKTKGLELGWKELISSPYPQNGNTYTAKYSEGTEKIYQEWVLTSVLPNSERRRMAYETEACCEYDGSFYTVDALEDLYYKYFAESGKEETCAAIKIAITEGKNHIREEYPDENQGE